MSTAKTTLHPANAFGATSKLLTWRQRLDDSIRPGKMDFAFAFAVVHETPSADQFFAGTACAMKSGAALLLAEPAGHVSEAGFSEELSAAAKHGLKIIDRLSLKRCHSALLQKM